MAEEDILGIGGHIDISEIQASFNALMDNLDKIGVKMNNVSAEMTKALNEIAQSSDVNSDKTQRAVRVIQESLSEVQNAIKDTPDILKKMSSEAVASEKSIEKLSKQLGETEAGSAKWKEINAQIETQKRLASQLNSEYSGLFSSLGNVQQYIGALNAAIEGLNAGRSISSAVTGASAVAHAGVATAVLSEATAHGQNAVKIDEETQKLNSNTDATILAVSASRQRILVSEEEAEAVQRLSEKIKNGQATEDEYIRAKENAEKRIEQLQQERSSLLEKQAVAFEAAQEAYNKRLNGQLSTEQSEEEFSKYSSVYESLSSQISVYAAKIKELRQSYTEMIAIYQEMQQSQQQQAQQQNAEIEAINKTKDAISDKEATLKLYNEQLEQMEAHHAKGWGGDFVENMRKGDNPFSAIKDYFEEGNAISEKKQQIADLTSEIEKLKSSASEVNAVVERNPIDEWAGKSADEIARITMENERALRILKEEARTIEKNTEDAKENAKGQKELSEEINSGRKRLKKMGEDYDELKKKIKAVAKESEKVGNNGNSILSKIKELKKSFSGGVSFDKIMGVALSSTGAGIAAVGLAAAGAVKGIKWLTEQAQALKEALLPLKSYLDSDTLEDLRQQFIALEYDSVHSAEEMAAAGTRWVKYFSGLRNNADAISDVVQNSNDLATVLGTTSEKASDYILKIAGAYHQSAAEAKANSDIIINASKKSIANYEEMAQALASNAPRAKALGITLTELAGAVSYGSSIFGSASAAASTYTMMMDRLSHQSKDKFNPTVVGATNALTALSKEKNTNAILTQLLGKRQATLAKVFVESADAIAKNNTSLNDHEKATKAVSAAESKAENNEKKLQNAKKALAHEINLNLTPAYTSFLEMLAGAMKSIGEVATEIKKSLDPLASWFSKFDDKFGKSKIWEYIKILAKGTFKAQIKGLFNPIAGLAFAPVEVNKEVNNYKKEKHQENIQSVWDENLKKYGATSPGKALIATMRTYTSASGSISKEDKDFILKLFRTYKAEQRAKPNGTDIKISNENSVPDKSDKGKEQRKYREQQAEEEFKKANEAEKLNWDLYIAQREQYIANIADLSEKEIEQRKLDYEKRKHEIDVEEKSMLQSNIGKAKSDYDKNPANKQKEGFYSSGLYKNVTLTDNQRQLINTKRENLETSQENNKKTRQDNIIGSLDDFLKKYGTNQQKQLSVARDYDRRIAKSSSPFEKASLEMEKQEELKKIKSEDAFASVDWEDVFSDLSSYTTKYLRKLKEQLQNLLKSEKLTDVSDIGKVQDKINDINDALNDQASIWDYVGKKQREHNRLVEEAGQAQIELTNAKKAEKDANVSYENERRNTDNVLADIGMGGTEYKGAQDLQTKISEKSSNLNAKQLTDANTAVQRLIIAEVNLAKARENTAKATKKAKEKEDNSKEKPADKVANWFSGIQEAIEKYGIDQIPGLMDSLGVKGGDKAQKGLDAFNSAAGAAEDFASGNYVGAALKGISAIKSFGSALGIGGGNAEKVNAETEKLTKSNELLRKSIDGLKEELSNQGGWKAINTANDAIKDQEKINAQTLKILQLQMGYTAAHHSNQYYWNLGKEDYESVNKTLAEYRRKNPNAETKKNSVYSLEDIYSLTPEQMKYIRDHNIEQWKKWTEIGKYDKSEYWNNYADLAGQLEEITESLNQALTQTTFECLKNDFASALMDMNKDAQDFADDFSKYMMQSVLNAKISDLLSDEIESFYKKWAAMAKSENKLDANEIEQLKKDWDALVKKGMDIRNEASQITGYTGESSKQNATANAITAITADQAATLIGIGYAVQIAVEHGNDLSEQISVDASALRTIVENMYLNITEMRDIQYQGLNQLQVIVKNTTPIIAMNETIGQMYKLMRERY